MNALRTALLIGMTAAAAFVAGCDERVVFNYGDDGNGHLRDRPGRARTVRLVFVNHTPAAQAVRIRAAGGRWQAIGRVSADGGELQRDVVLAGRSLPAEYLWDAGQFDGSVTVTANSPDRQRIILGEPGRDRPGPHGPDRPALPGRDDRGDRDGRDDREGRDGRVRPGQEVHLEFVSRLNQQRNVFISIAGAKRQLVGAMGPLSRLSYDLVIPRRDLPVTVGWYCYKYSGSFVVTPRTDRMRIVVDTPGSSVGPGKEVNLVFVNRLNQRRNIWISVAGGKKQTIGAVGPRAELSYDLVVPRHMLPATINWGSNRITGSFEVGSRTDRLRIIVDEP